MFDDNDVIYVYSRQQALADGVLIDVSRLANEAGFKIPVAVTSAVWATYVRVPAGVEAQDEQGRLWDILWMCHWAIRRHVEPRNPLIYELSVMNRNQRHSTVRLKAVCGPDDDGAPCLTIMLPDED